MRKFLFKHMAYSFALGVGFGLVASLVFVLAQKEISLKEKACHSERIFHE